MLKADKKIVITFVVMILVACTAFGGYSYINSPKRKMNQLLEEQDYAEAITCYNETIKASKYEEEFNSVLIALIESTTDEWETEIISYEEVIYALEKFSMINNPAISGLVQEKISHIKIETEGDKLLTKAKESFEKAKYIETLQALLTIDSNYSQYESALKLKKNNKEEFLLTVSSPETVDEYESAISYLDKYLALENDNDVLKRKVQLEKELVILKDILSIIQTATSLYDNRMYSEAFFTLAAGLEEYPMNELLETTLVNFHDHYVIDITTQVADLCEAEEYNEALDVLEEALLEYDCEEFRELQELVKEEKSFLYKLKNDLVEKFKTWTQGIKEEKFNVKQMANDTGAYIVKSGEKLALGEYSEEDITVLSFGGNVVSSLLGLDLAFDLRDLTYDLTHWGESDYFVANLTTDVVALLPVAGVIKYASHFTDFAKNTDNVADLVDSVADLSKQTDNVVELPSALKLALSKADDLAESISNHKNVVEIRNLANKVKKNVCGEYEIVKTRNNRLVGQKHEKTGIEFVETKQKYSDGRKLQLGVPVFDSKANVQLPANLYTVSTDKQNDYCLKQLQEIIEKPFNKTKNNFTADELEKIKQQELPDGYTWHHNEKEGLMQLVDSETHKNTGHTGGNHLWGPDSVAAAA